jgi:RNA polymerase sigma factor (TIGR02999 family)
MEEPLNNEQSLTEQLRRFSGGDRTIAEAVLRQVLPELHRIAVRALGKQYKAPALSPMELINEAWLRSLNNGVGNIESRQHFYSIAALAMRNVLVDFARMRTAQRRGRGEELLSIDSEAGLNLAEPGSPEMLVTIGLLMERLEKRDPETARIVDLHYFSGFTLEEISDISGLTFRQVRHRWERGRDWLRDGLASPKHDPRKGPRRLTL